MPITNYFDNTGGINTTDSPLYMKDNQASTGSYNYDYARTGAITKNLGPQVINSSADSQLTTLGLLEYHSATSDTRTIIRAAGTQLQTFDPSTGTIVVLTDDTVTAGTTFLSSSSTQPVVGSDFTNGTVTELWMAGGGMSTIYGYNGTNITANGVQPAAGSVGTTVNTSAGGSFAAAGTYFYAVTLHKASSGSTGNLSLDVSATTVNTADTVTLDLTTITAFDQTLYDQIWIYRSAISGVTGFTTGDLIAKIASSSTSYTDTGSYISTVINVPRAGNVVLDNSPLPSQTYKTVTTFKQRLVTASGNNVYLSDQNKSESWPLTNVVTLSTGGPITSVSVIGFNAPFSSGTDEYLVIHKDDEIWVITGNSFSDWVLKFIDEVGCPGQSLVVTLNGFIAWMDYRGIYIWDGHSKPIYTSRPIESMFARDGDLDKSMLKIGWGQYFRKKHQAIWQVSHRTKGTQNLRIRMDLRLTVPQASGDSDTRVIDGVFSFDTDIAMYAGLTFRPAITFEEQFIAGGAAGYVWNLYTSFSYATPFVYITKPLNMGDPVVKKRFKRVIVWMERYVDKDLTLYYATDFRNRSTDLSKESTTMAPRQGSVGSLWDVAIWDVNLWDDYATDVDGIEFNLHAEENNAEGDTLQLQFSQTEGSAPVVIHGFTIDWEPVAATSRSA